MLWDEGLTGFDHDAWSGAQIGDYAMVGDKINSGELFILSLVALIPADRAS